MDKKLRVLILEDVPVDAENDLYRAQVWTV